MRPPSTDSWDSSADTTEPVLPLNAEAPPAAAGGAFYARWELALVRVLRCLLRRLRGFLGSLGRCLRLSLQLALDGAGLLLVRLRGCTDHVGRGRTARNAVHSHIGRC